MSLIELALLAAAAVAAGSINGAVGSGSLVTLPILLALGLEPGTAVATNTIAMVFSAFGGVIAYRAELKSDLPRLRNLIITSFIGGTIGAILLVSTPPDAIGVIVPVLIAVALLLVLLQPVIARRVRERYTSITAPYQGLKLRASILGCSIYGGYFAAAQGVLLLGVLGIFTGQAMSRINGVKNLLTLTVNVTAALLFTATSVTGVIHVEWIAVIALAIGASIGGYTGGRLARKAPAWLLRAVIVAVGLASIAQQVAG